MGRALVPCPTCDGYKHPDAALCQTCRETTRHAPRPRHFPPACPTCHGFGFVNESSSAPWTRCRTCKAHPGNLMSHSDWTAQRA